MFLVLGLTRADKNMESVLVVGKCARTSSEHCPGTPQPGAKPTYTQIGPWDELMTHAGGTCLHPLCALTFKWIKQLRRHNKTNHLNIKM